MCAPAGSLADSVVPPPGAVLRPPATAAARAVRASGVREPPGATEIGATGYAPVRPAEQRVQDQRDDDEQEHRERERPVIPMWGVVRADRREDHTRHCCLLLPVIRCHLMTGRDGQPCVRGASRRSRPADSSADSSLLNHSSKSATPATTIGPSMPIHSTAPRQLLIVEHGHEVMRRIRIDRVQHTLAEYEHHAQHRRCQHRAHQQRDPAQRRRLLAAAAGTRSAGARTASQPRGS